jgi:RecJ-like exonuclease
MVGGWGGGHKYAAGAFIPKGKEKEFIDAVNNLLGE